MRSKARAFMAAGQFDDALCLWRDVAVYGPLCVETFLGKARCLAELGSIEEAIEELETAVALDDEAHEQIDDDVVLGGVWRYARG